MATFYVLHPRQYIQSREIMFAMMHPDNSSHNTVDWDELLPLWGTTFHAISGISRRSAPPHRDPRTSSVWFDFLVSAGQYGDAWLHLPSLQTQCFVPPGTLSAFSGRLIRHSVSHAYTLAAEAGLADQVGNRLCLAYYMRTEHAHNLQVPIGCFALAGIL